MTIHRMVFAEDSQALAQAFCDDIHQRLIDRNGGYRLKVQRGQTTAYATPYQEYDQSGDPDNPALVDARWFVNIREIGYSVLTPGERALLVVHPRSVL